MSIDAVFCHPAVRELQTIENSGLTGAGLRPVNKNVEKVLVLLGNLDILPLKESAVIKV